MIALERVMGARCGELCMGEWVRVRVCARRGRAVVIVCASHGFISPLPLL